MNRSYLEILSQSENLSAAAVGADRETVGRLCRAAPALALACLEARKFFRSFSNLSDDDQDIERLKQLETALAAAGVEVQDGE